MKKILSTALLCSTFGSPALSQCVSTTCIFLDCADYVAEGESLNQSNSSLKRKLANTEEEFEYLEKRSDELRDEAERLVDIAKIMRNDYGVQQKTKWAIRDLNNAVRDFNGLLNKRRDWKNSLRKNINRIKELNTYYMNSCHNRLSDSAYEYLCRDKTPRVQNYCRFLGY